MSRALYDAKKGYLHSPVDDLESFFWVAVWSVFFNKDHKGAYSDVEKDIMDHLTQGDKDRAMNQYSGLVCDATTSNIGRHLQAVMYAWWKKVRDRNVTWSMEVLTRAPENAGRDYYLPHFHRFALEGVADILEVLSHHWDKEIGWKSWAGPEA